MRPRWRRETRRCSPATGRAGGDGKRVACDYPGRTSVPVAAPGDGHGLLREIRTQARTAPLRRRILRHRRDPRPRDPHADWRGARGQPGSGRAARRKLTIDIIDLPWLFVVIDRQFLAGETRRPRPVRWAERLIFANLHRSRPDLSIRTHRSLWPEWPGDERYGATYMPVDYDLIRLVACCRSVARELEPILPGPRRARPGGGAFQFRSMGRRAGEDGARREGQPHRPRRSDRHGTGGDHHPGRDAGLPVRRFRRAGDYRVGPRARAVSI